MGVYLNDLNLYGAGQAMLLGGSTAEFHIHKLEYHLNKVRGRGETTHESRRYVTGQSAWP